MITLPSNIAPVAGCLPVRWQHGSEGICLGLPSSFFPGILLSRKPPETRENGQCLERTMVEKNGWNRICGTTGYPVFKWSAQNHVQNEEGGYPQRFLAGTAPY